MNSPPVSDITALLVAITSLIVAGTALIRQIADILPKQREHSAQIVQLSEKVNGTAEPPSE